MSVQNEDFRYTCFTQLLRNGVRPFTRLTHQINLKVWPCLIVFRYKFGRREDDRVGKVSITKFSWLPDIDDDTAAALLCGQGIAIGNVLCFLVHDD